MLHTTKNEQGLSLIEVVVSVLLIGLTLTAFFTLLVQSNKTTVSSETILDATYAAQQEMEHFYTLSHAATNVQGIMGGAGYIFVTKEVIPSSDPINSFTINGTEVLYYEKFIYTKEDADYSYTVTIRTFNPTSNPTYKNLLNLSVSTQSKSRDNSAVMESVYTLGGAS